MMDKKQKLAALDALLGDLEPGEAEEGLAEYQPPSEDEAGCTCGTECPVHGADSIVATG